jgi:SAM-dependent methyltransferase
MSYPLETTCPICFSPSQFDVPSDRWALRDLSSQSCNLGGCVTRDRALAHVISVIWGRENLQKLRIHEAAPSGRGISLWLSRNVEGYEASGYYPSLPFGQRVNGLRNEDLERQTYKDDIFDLVIHLDVLEHVFSPFLALKEIFRTLIPGGYTIFSVPTEPGRLKSEQVAFPSPDGRLNIIGEPEYHGNPQRPSEGALVCWRFGYDLPFLLKESTGFDVEVRRFESDQIAALGHMTEIYICRRPINSTK